MNADKVEAKKVLDKAVEEYLANGGKIVVNAGTLKKRAKKKKADTSHNSFVTYHTAARNRAFGGN
jgi:hypothetical protein